MSRSEAGRLGGLSLFAKYGRGYMRKIGKAGARAFHEKYSLKPYGTYQWAIVRRSDNIIIGYTLDWRHK